MTPATRAGAELSTLVEEILTSYYDAHPTRARHEGLHAYDGRMPDMSRTGLDVRAEELADSITRLSALDTKSLDRAERLDHRCLLAACRNELFRLREWRVWARYPIEYLDLVDVSDYVKRDYAPIPDRVAAICLHLEGIPRLLDEARENLNVELDRTVLSSAIELFQSWVEWLDGELDPLLGEDLAGEETLRQALLQARAQAKEAGSQFVAFLRDRAREAPRGLFPVGPDILQKMLLYGEGVDVRLDRLLELGERELDRNRRLLHETASRIDASSTPAEVMEHIKRDHPSGEEVLETTKRLADELKRFLEEHDLVTIPDASECRVEPTPSFWSFAFAMVDWPGSFEEADVPGFYYVTPPRPEWGEEKAEQWLQEFSHAGLANTSVHEVWPGHFLHSLHIRRSPSRVLRTFHSYASCEAWAHYCEEMMLDAGYRDGDPKLRMIQIGDALLRATRLVVSVRMHTLGMTLDEARDLFHKEALISDAAAEAEAERGTFDPGYLNYTLGKMMLRKLRNDWQAIRGKGASLREFHDEFLGCAAAPVPFVRERMLPADSGDVL